MSAAITLDLSTNWQGTVSFAGIGTDTIRNFEGVIGATAAYNDSITGSSGNDVIGGGGGVDTLIGGDGIDTLSFAWAEASVNVNLATSTMTNDGYYRVDVFSGFENVDGGRAADSIVGSSVSNVIRGDTGNDTIVGSAGNDTLDGGNGTDLLTYASETTSMSINLMTGRMTTETGRFDVITNFESIQGGTGNDTIEVSSLSETVRGGAGNDVFVTGLDALNGDLFDGETGFVIPEGNIALFIDALEKLAKDPELRNKMGAEGRRFVQTNYSIQHLNDQLLQIYS
jgi:Ca2+-binding RTX toxin-like protein